MYMGTGIRQRSFACWLRMTQGKGCHCDEGRISRECEIDLKHLPEAAATLPAGRNLRRMPEPNKQVRFMTDNKIAIFRGKSIRKTIHKNEWWFSVIDVVEALTGSSIPKRYWTDLKRKLSNEGYDEVYEKIVRLKLESADGKQRETDCASTETMFRIVQSIPSPKAEPFFSAIARLCEAIRLSLRGAVLGAAAIL